MSYGAASPEMKNALVVFDEVIERFPSIITSSGLVSVLILSASFETGAVMYQGVNVHFLMLLEKLLMSDLQINEQSFHLTPPCKPLTESALEERELASSTQKL